ncbi:MAG TPA: hypothetical protein VI318_21280 [Baekduia sp.]
MAAAAFAVALGPAAPARAADADATAVAVAPGDGTVYVGGSASFPDDARSGVVGRLDPTGARVAWLARVDSVHGLADGFTAVVPDGPFVYGVGYTAGGALAVAKMDAGTGRLRQACGSAGVRLSSLGAPVVPGKAVASGGDLLVVGATLGAPTRGFVAEVDGDDCTLKRSAIVGAGSSGQSVGFTAVDRDPAGDLVVSGFSGSRPAVFRFSGDLVPMGAQPFDVAAVLGGAFSDVRATGDGKGGVAVGVAGGRVVAQCFTLPALNPDARCGPTGQRAPAFAADGTATGSAALAQLPSGSWVVAGAHSGHAGFTSVQTRPAIGVLSAADLSTGAARVFDPFPSTPSTLAAVAASAQAVVAAGTTGTLGARRAFLLTSAPDGTATTFRPLGFDTAAPAPLEPPPPAPAAAATPPAPTMRTPAPAAKGPAFARAWFSRLLERPGRDGTFGLLTVRCPRTCRASGTFSARVPGGRTVRLGGTTAKVAAGWGVGIRLALSHRGLRTLTHAHALHITIRFGLTDTTGRRQIALRPLTLRARRAH